MSNDLKGYIFGCTQQTEQECLKKCLFGQWENKLGEVEQLKVAASGGALRIDPTAWRTSKNALTPFPAQINVNKPVEIVCLREEVFKHILQTNYHGTEHIKSYKLSEEQVRLLVLEMNKNSVSTNFYPPEKLIQVDRVVSSEGDTDAIQHTANTFNAAEMSIIQDLQHRLDTQESQNLVVLRQIQSDLDEQEKKFNKIISEQKQQLFQQFNKFKWELQDEVDNLKTSHQQFFKSMVNNVMELNNKVGFQSKNVDLQKGLKELSLSMTQIDVKLKGGISSEDLLKGLKSTSKTDPKSIGGSKGRIVLSGKKDPQKDLNLFDV